MATKALPDAATAYQQWMARRIEMMTKDGQKFLADSHKFVSGDEPFLPERRQGLQQVAIRKVIASEAVSQRGEGNCDEQSRTYMHVVFLIAFVLSPIFI